MDVAIRRDGRAAILEVQGEVDLYTSPRLREALVGLMDGKSPAVLVDLSRVEYMDSSGVATLVEGLQLARKTGGQFKLAGLAPGIRDVFRFARLEKVFEIYEDTQAALQALR
jgi:anti-sigma B factor antagonist